MDWKKPLCGKNHADDFLLSVLISVYDLKAKVVLKTNRHPFLTSHCVGEDCLRLVKQRFFVVVAK